MGTPLPTVRFVEQSSLAAYKMANGMLTPLLLRMSHMKKRGGASKISWRILTTTSNKVFSVSTRTLCICQVPQSDKELPSIMTPG